jgi:hypothetical protein
VHRLSPLVLLPVAKLFLHLATFRGYGLFRDEFYYIACSKRLAFGYVDHPPLAMLLLAVQRTLLGDSLLALRVLPALAGALTVLVVGLLTRELGGGKFAQILAMTAVGIEFLGVFHVYSMNCFDVLIWATVAYLLALIAHGSTPRLWLLLGLLLGLGLQNKISVLWLATGLAAALIVTRERRWLRTRWPWLAAGLALLVFVPHLLWQVRSDWPTLEFIRNATGEKMVEVAPLEFIRGQLSMFGPSVVPLWLGGLVYLLVAREARSYRVLGWIYLVVFAILLLSGSSRAGYLGPAYSWLLAAGAVAWEAWVARRGIRWLEAATLAVVVGFGVLYLPFSLPVLPVETYISYADRLGVGPTTEERKELAELPQGYADRHGWDELVDTVAGVHESLSPEEREVATIFTYNYGNSGAIDHLGRNHGLPPSISGHNNYWLWGPGEATGEVVLVVGGSDEGLRRLFDRVERAATIDCRYCMPYEDDKPVWIARGIRRPLSQVWPDLKHYD